MKKIFYIVMLLLCIGNQPLPAVELTVSPAAGTIKLNDVITFQVNGEAPAPGVTEFVYRLYADGAEFQSGKVKLGEQVSVTAAEPGFVLFSIHYMERETRKKIYFRTCVGVAVDQIKPASEKPEDFAAFWREAKAELAAVPLRAVLEPVRPPADAGNGIQVFDVKIDSVGQVPVSGYLALPENAAPKSLPALVNFHGAGVRSAAMPLCEAQRGILALDVNAHGILNGMPANYYAELNQTTLADYRRRNADDPRANYFRNLFLRTSRALEFIKSRPEWDGRILIVSGGSQGGAQALAAAALDPQVTCCVAMVPAMCDHHGILHHRRASWPYFIQRKNGRVLSPETVEAVRYYDVAFFASEIAPETECFLTLGLLDTVCPPSSVCAAFNSLRSRQKQLYIAPGQSHTLTPDVFGLGDEFIDRHIARKKNQSDR